jgi:hypothetical protein
MEKFGSGMEKSRIRDREKHPGSATLLFVLPVTCWPAPLRLLRARLRVEDAQDELEAGHAAVVLAHVLAQQHHVSLLFPLTLYSWTQMDRE